MDKFDISSALAAWQLLLARLQIIGCCRNSSTAFASRVIEKNIYIARCEVGLYFYKYLKEFIMASRSKTRVVEKSTGGKIVFMFMVA